MARLLFLLFLIVPLIEIGLFIVIGQAIGILPTLLGVLVTALIGSVLIRQQGVSLLFEIRELSAQGQMPARQIVEGIMLAVAGALLLTPGYFTDLMGFVLLVPAIRAALYEWLKTRVNVVHTTGGGGRPRPDDGVVDLDRDNWRE